jgi:hypothetical protein
MLCLVSRHIHVTRRRPSLGIVHPGRPGGHIVFSTAAQSWLHPLLARFDVCWAGIVAPRGRRQYVFVSARSAVHDLPVSRGWVWGQVKQPTQLLLGYADPPSDRAAVATRVVDGVSRMRQFFPALVWVPGSDGLDAGRD